MQEAHKKEELERQIQRDMQYREDKVAEQITSSTSEAALRKHKTIHENKVNQLVLDHKNMVEDEVRNIYSDVEQNINETVNKKSRDIQTRKSIQKKQSNGFEEHNYYNDGYSSEEPRNAENAQRQSFLEFKNWKAKTKKNEPLTIGSTQAQPAVTHSYNPPHVVDAPQPRITQSQSVVERIPFRHPVVDRSQNVEQPKIDTSQVRDIQPTQSIVSPVLPTKPPLAPKPSQEYGSGVLNNKPQPIQLTKRPSQQKLQVEEQQQNSLSPLPQAITGETPMVIGKNPFQTLSNDRYANIEAVTPKPVEEAVEEESEQEEEAENNEPSPKSKFMQAFMKDVEKTVPKPAQKQEPRHDSPSITITASTPATPNPMTPTPTTPIYTQVQPEPEQERPKKAKIEEVKPTPREEPKPEPTIKKEEPKLNVKKKEDNAPKLQPMIETSEEDEPQPKQEPPKVEPRPKPESKASIRESIAKRFAFKKDSKPKEPEPEPDSEPELPNLPKKEPSPKEEPKPAKVEEKPKKKSVEKTETPVTPITSATPTTPSEQQPEDKKKKKGLGGLLSGVFKKKEKEAKVEIEASSEAPSDNEYLVHKAQDRSQNDKVKQTLAKKLPNMLVTSFRGLSKSIETSIAKKHDESMKTSMAYKLQQGGSDMAGVELVYANIGKQVSADARLGAIQSFTEEKGSTNADLPTQCVAVLDILKYSPQPLISNTLIKEELSKDITERNVDPADIREEYFTGPSQQMWDALVEHVANIIAIDVKYREAVLNIFSEALYPSKAEIERGKLVPRIKVILKASAQKVQAKKPPEKKKEPEKQAPEPEKRVPETKKAAPKKSSLSDSDSEEEAPKPVRAVESQFKLSAATPKKKGSSLIMGGGTESFGVRPSSVFSGPRSGSSVLGKIQASKSNNFDFDEFDSGSSRKKKKVDDDEFDD